MNVRIFIDRNQYAIEIRHNNQRLIRYTDIPDSYMGGEFIIQEECEDKLIYKISPLYEKLNTENGYILNYNIKLTNWLNFFIYKSIGSIVNNTELIVKKVPSDFLCKLIESTSVKLKP